MLYCTKKNKLLLCKSTIGFNIFDIVFNEGRLGKILLNIMEIFFLLDEISYVLFVTATFLQLMTYVEMDLHP